MNHLWIENQGKVWVLSYQLKFALFIHVHYFYEEKERIVILVKCSSHETYTQKFNLRLKNLRQTREEKNLLFRPLINVYKQYKFVNISRKIVFLITHIIMIVLNYN